METGICIYCGNKLYTLDIGSHPSCKINIDGNDKLLFFCCEKCKNEFLTVINSFKVDN